MPDKGRLDHLDGLRGIASLVVILHHAMLALHPPYANYSTHYLNAAHTLPFAPLALLWQGNLCVCIFFILSGYVLAPVMMRSKAGLPALLVRRVVRLALPTLAALLFGYGLMRLGLYTNRDASEVSGSQGWWGLLFAGPASLLEVLHDVAAMPFVPNASQYDPVVWTMHVEYFGSFGIFLIYKFLRWQKLRLAFLIGALYFTANTYYFDFVAGALLADISMLLQQKNDVIPRAGEEPISPPNSNVENIGTMGPRPSPRMTIKGGSVLAFLCFALFLLFGAVTWSDGEGEPFHWLDWLPQTIIGTAAEGSHQIAALFLLLAIIFSAGLRRFLAWRGFVKLGNLSFGVYLLHLPLICSLGGFVLLMTHAALGFVPSAVLAVAAVIATTIALAVPFTRYIDAPTNRLSQIVGKRIDIWWNRYCTVPVGRLWHHVRHGQAS